MRSHREPPTVVESPTLHRRRKNASDHPLSTAIPVVVADVDANRHLTVTVDGVLLTAEPIGRAAFGSLMDEIIRKRGTALRVQVRESDGTEYTDLLTPPAHVDAERSEAEPEVRGVDAATDSALLDVTGDGFVPGEEVAFAPILIHSSARSDGSVRSLVEFDGQASELLMFGRVSGTVHVVRPRS